MIYKLLIVRNRYTKKLNLAKGLDWFKKSTPMEMVTEEIFTDFDVTTENISNATYSGVICGDDIYPKLRTVIPEGKYHAVVFIYGNKLNGIRVNVAKQLPLYPGTDLIQLCTLSDKGKSLNHEIFHTFIHRLQRQQVLIEDPMDSVVIDGEIKNYYHNDDLDAVPSNRSIAIGRITPYWNLVGNIITTIPAPMPTPPPPAPNTYKWFSAAEVAKWKLKPELWVALDKMRDLANTPFIITSGLRTPAENAAVGGKPNSAHLKGLACDIACTDNLKRTLMIRGILNSGIPVFLEDAVKHLHVDIDASIHTLGQTMPSNDD